MSTIASSRYVRGCSHLLTQIRTMKCDRAITVGTDGEAAPFDNQEAEERQRKDSARCMPIATAAIGIVRLQKASAAAQDHCRDVPPGVLGHGQQNGHAGQQDGLGAEGARAAGLIALSCRRCCWLDRSNRESNVSFPGRQTRMASVLAPMTLTSTLVLGLQPGGQQHAPRTFHPVDQRTRLTSSSNGVWPPGSMAASSLSRRWR